MRKTVESVLSQTYDDFEYIIVDGASTDGSQDYLREIEKKWDRPTNRLHIISEPDTGIYNAMNKGIRMAKGDYCLFLNSGDYLAQADTLQQVFTDFPYGTDIVYGNCIQIWSDGRTKLTDYPHNVTGRTMINGTLPHQASFILRSLFDTIGLYREDLFFGSDWEFYLKALFYHQCSFRFINHYICFFDMSGISTNPSLTDKMMNERTLVMQDLIPQLYDDYMLLNEYERKLLSVDKKAMLIGTYVLKPFRFIKMILRSCF